MPDIYYRLKDFKSRATQSPVVIVGNNQEAVSAALSLANKFQHIYLCNSELTLHCDNIDALAIHNAKNIAYLPNCTILNCNKDTKNKLKEIQLDTYETLSCKAILYFGEQIPNTSFITSQLLKLTTDKHIEVTETYQAIDFPEIYAVGSCCNKTNYNGSGKLAANNILKLLED